MFYEEYGDKSNQTIIMIHGGGCVHSFVHQYVVQDRFHLVIPHLYGHGKESNMKFDVLENVNAIAEVIKKFGKNKVNVVGFSIGAQIMIPLLCSYSNLINKAILVSPWVIKNEKMVKKYAKITSITYPFTKVKFLIKYQAKLLGLNKTQLNESIEYYKNMTKENLVSIVSNGVNIYDYPTFKDVKVEMITISGEKEVKDMIKSVEYLSEINSNCSIEIWQRYGHDIPIKNPQRFNQLLIDFFA